MAIIYIRNNGQQIEASMAHSLLVFFQINEVPIRPLCGGRAKCGNCVIRVHRGREYMSPRLSAEASQLEAIGADESMRLACKCHAARDLEVEIIHFGSRSD